MSGGQKQRIGLARAFYRDSNLLILDESTSALDVHTEKEILDKLHNSSDELTLLMISHKISTLEMCDRILWFDKGKLVMDGSPSEILSIYKSKFQQING